MPFVEAPQGNHLSPPPPPPPPQQNQTLVEEFNRGLENVVDVLTVSRDSPFGLPPSTGPVHCGIICDQCQQTVVGVRYKCGYVSEPRPLCKLSTTCTYMMHTTLFSLLFSNCPDYDLCEKCEAYSDQIHPSDHVFLKMKVPARHAGMNKKGDLKPLLRRNIYRHFDEHATSRLGSCVRSLDYHVT